MAAAEAAAHGPRPSRASWCSSRPAWWRCRSSGGSASGRCSAIWQPARHRAVRARALLRYRDHPARRRARGGAVPLRDRARDAAVAALGDARRDLRARAWRRSALCMLLLWTVGPQLGYPLAPSLIAGTGFVLTSTAIVMQMLRGARHDQPAEGTADHRHPVARGSGDRAAARARRLPRARRRGGDARAAAGRGRRSASRRSRRWSRRGAGCSTPSSASSPCRGRAR